MTGPEAVLQVRHHWASENRIREHDRIVQSILNDQGTYRIPGIYSDNEILLAWIFDLQDQIANRLHVV